MENIKVGDWVGFEVSRRWRRNAETVVLGGRVISVAGENLIVKVTTRRETGQPLVTMYTVKVSELVQAPEKYLDEEALITLIREFDAQGVK